MKPPRMPLTGRRLHRSTFSVGNRWGSCLVGAASIAVALAGGCRTAADDCADSMCDDVDSFWVLYDAWALDNAYQDMELRVEPDGAYRMWLGREEGTPPAQPGCGSAGGPPCSGGSGSYLCMTGRLDDDQLAAVDAVQQSDLMDAYALDQTPGDAPADRSVKFQPIEDGAEAHHFHFYSVGPLQPETSVLVDTLDGISLDLYERAEYCSEEDSALAEDGEWGFPISDE